MHPFPVEPRKRSRLRGENVFGHVTDEGPHMQSDILLIYCLSAPPWEALFQAGVTRWLVGVLIEVFVDLLDSLYFSVTCDEAFFFFSFFKGPDRKEEQKLPGII